MLSITTCFAHAGKALCFKRLLPVMVLIMSSGNIFAQVDWTKYPGNPLNLNGSNGSWDKNVACAGVIFNADSDRYEMWYTGTAGFLDPSGRIGFAYSSDGMSWTKNLMPVLTPGLTGWDSLFVGVPCIIRENGIYKMWYTGWKSTSRYPHSIGYAWSTDGGQTWTKHPDPVLSPGSGWESGAVGYPSVIKVPGGYWMFYTGEISIGVALTGRAFSTDGITWERDLENNPVLPAGNAGAWDRNNFLARVIEMNDGLYLWYTAEDNPGISGMAIGFATSADTGKTWTKYSGNPVLKRGSKGSWDYDWIEAGSVLIINDTLHLYYDGGGSQDRIGLATAPTRNYVSLFDFEVLSQLQVQFTNKSIGIISNWFWNFGDGNTSTEINPLHTYNQVGNYTIGLTVSGPYGSDSSSQQIVLTNIAEDEYNTPLQYTLRQNYPNPFNPYTTIDYEIPFTSHVDLNIYNILGQKVATLVSNQQLVGKYNVLWDATGFASGVYYYRLETKGYCETRKLILMK